MLSQIHFKLRSQRAYSTVGFEGPFLQLSELKKHVADKLGLLKAKAGTDFELKITDAQSNQEYKGDQTKVPKNCSVLVSRLPAHNGLPQWLHSARLEKMRASDPVLPSAAPASGAESVAVSNVDNTLGEGDEAARLGQLADQMSDRYKPKQTQAALPNLRFSGSGHGGYTPIVKDPQPGTAEKERDIPPPEYQCHRCFKFGHYKQDCPTIGDPRYDACRQHVGIPADKIVPMSAERSEQVHGRQINLKGEFVEVLGDDKEFSRQLGLSKDAGSEVIPDQYKCPTCGKLLVDAVMTRCCKASFCDGCIRPALMKNPHCPLCQKQCMPDDDLLPSTELRAAIEREDWKKVPEKPPPPAPVPAPPEVIPPPPPPPPAPEIVPPPPPKEAPPLSRDDFDKLKSAEAEEDWGDDPPLSREEFEQLQREGLRELEEEREREEAEAARREERKRDEERREERRREEEERRRDEERQEERRREERRAEQRWEEEREALRADERRRDDERAERRRSEGKRSEDDRRRREDDRRQGHRSPARMRKRSRSRERRSLDHEDGVLRTSSGLVLSDAREKPRARDIPGGLISKGKRREMEARSARDRHDEESREPEERRRREPLQEYVPPGRRDDVPSKRHRREEFNRYDPAETDKRTSRARYH